jgi:hypothetical protein
LALLLAVLALVSTLAGCNNSSTHTPGATPSLTTTTTPPPITLHGWNAVPSPGVSPEGHLSAVAASSATDAWAVGEFEGTDSLEHPLAEHWNGSSWTTTQMPTPGQQDNSLSGVAELSPTNVWAVGAQTNGAGATHPLIERWNGAQWSVVPAPNITATSATLSGVAGSSAGDVWAVGDATTITNQNIAIQLPLLLHWNGSSWSVAQGAGLPGQQPGTSYFAQLSGVVALAANNAWAVGSVPAQFGQSVLIEHWNGSTWSLVAGANPGQNGDDSLVAVSADSPNDLWAVGTGPLPSAQGCALASNALVEHWNGIHWTSVAPALPPSPSGVYVPFGLADVAAVAPNDVWIAGGYRTGSSTGYTSIAPTIEHWNGSGWSIVQSPNIATTAGLEGMAASGGTAWAVGQTKATNGAGPTLIEQLTSGQWGTVTSDSPGTVANQLNAISAPDLWAVGQSAIGTLAEHWDGQAWSVVPTPNGPLGTNTLNGVVSVSSSNAWAVGEQPVAASGLVPPGSTALIEHWDGSTWSIVAAPAKSQPLSAITADSATDAWAAGTQNILHWNGSTWSSVPLPFSIEGSYFGVAALAPNNVWAVGGVAPAGCGGDLPATIAHWDGHTWSLVPNTPQGVLFGVSASRPNDVWAVGLNGLIMHYNGQRWSTVAGAGGNTYAQAELRGVSARAPNDAWVVGASNTAQVIIEHWNGSAWSAAQASGPGLGFNNLNAVVAISASEVWAVGEYNDAGFSGGEASEQALIEHYTA